MKVPTREHIYIYDHPESKIRFLEETLAGKDWRATLVYPDGTDQERQHLAEAQAAFQKRGYLVHNSVDAHGLHLLTIHHVGDGSKPSEIIQEMGLAKGTAHLITNPSQPLTATFGAAKEQLLSLIKTGLDPAHLNGLIYIAAEAFLMWPGHQDGEPGKPKNTLRKLGFGLFFAQSLTYLFGAKDNDTVSFDEFKNKITTSMKQGKDLTQIHYDPEADKAGQGVGHSFIRLLRRYPIEAGALFNNLGMLLYSAGSIVDKRYYQNIMKTGGTAKQLSDAHDYLKKGTGFLGFKDGGGFQNDIRGAATSMVAWMFMLIKPKQKADPDQPQSDNIFARAWDGMRENPQMGAGLLTLAASSQRLAGAKIRGEKNQAIGEKIYIGGDLALLFTKNDHYGKKNGNVDKLSEALADYINKMPVLLGPKSQQDMVKNMSVFLLNKGLSEIKTHPKTVSFTADELQQRADLLTLEVGRRVRNSYHEQMEQLGDVTARLVAQFSDSQRPALIPVLAEALSKFSWVYASPDEIKPILETSVKHLPPCIDTGAAITMKATRQAIADIVAIIPEVDAGGTAALLYDSITPFMAPKAEAKPSTPTSKVQKVTHLAQLQALEPQTVARS